MGEIWLPIEAKKLQEGRTTNRDMCRMAIAATWTLEICKQELHDIGAVAPQFSFADS